MDKDIRSYDDDLFISISTFNKTIENYKFGMRSLDFYEEPLGEDFSYPDW